MPWHPVRARRQHRAALPARPLLNERLGAGRAHPPCKRVGARVQDQQEPMQSTSAVKSVTKVHLIWVIHLPSL